MTISIPLSRCLDIYASIFPSTSPPNPPTIQTNTGRCW